MADLPTFDTRMSDPEALMWRADIDPFLSSTFATITVLDRLPDMARLRRRMERAANVLPRLHQRVQSAPANLRPPIWVTDRHFELDYHVRHVALPSPGSMDQLLELTRLITTDPFDRSRPLWQFTVVEGLEGGRAALIQKMHHTITDGEGAVQIALEFLDFAADAPEPAPVVRVEAEAEEPEPSAGELLRQLMAGSVRTPLGMMRQWNQLLTHPRRLPAAGSAAAATVRSAMQQLGVNDRQYSPLWTERSLRRRIEVLHTPFAPTKEAAAKLGGTINTAFVTAAADAAGAYHSRLGVPVEELRTTMAVSTRTAGSGTNAFSLVRLVVPTGKMPIAERFRAIHAASEAARNEEGTSLDSIATVVGTLPTSLITRVARLASQAIDFATSNVRGSPVPVYVAGAEVLANYPVGPLAGVAYNLTLLSYNGRLDIGVNADTAAITEPALLRECLETSFAELAAVADGSSPARRPPRKAAARRPAKKKKAASKRAAAP
jgi:diacylglycerol O-acyltransferase / wax synthase